MDRIGRLLGNVFSTPIPNGTGVKSRLPATAEVKGLSVDWSVLGAFIPTDSRGGTIDVESVSRRAYTASVLAYAAMRYRAQKLSEAPLFVADETEEGEPWLQDHELAGLLQYPNDDEEMADLVEATSIALDETGMAIWVIDRDRGKRPARLTLYSAAEFTVTPTADRIYGRFELTNVRGAERFREPQDVVFFRLPHPTDRWRGLAPARVLAAQLGIEAKLLQSIMHGLDNAVVPGTTVQFREGHGPVNVEQMAEYRAMIAASYAEARNHGKTFIASGADVVQNTLGFTGLEGGGLYREIEAAVCVAFGVRPEILGMMVGLENSPWSHMATAQRLAYDETIIPLWRRMERALTRQLLRPLDEDTSRKILFDLGKIRALQADAERDARRAVLVKGIATRNQRRQIAGLEPMDEDPEFWDAVEVAASPEPGSRNADMLKQAEPPRLATKSAAVRWLIFDEVTRGQEFGWEVAMRQHLDGDRAAVLAVIDRAKAGAAPIESKAPPPPPPYGPADPAEVRRIAKEMAAAIDQRATQLAAITGPLLEAAARGAVQRVAAELSLSFDLLQPGLEKYVRKHSAEFVTQVTTTTKDAIRDALARGLVEGESIPELASRIADSGAFAPSRAELIARTETTAAANESQVSSLLDYSERTGTAFRKTWLAAQDDRVRDEHAELDGTEIGLDEVFGNGLYAPGEPNCRCTLLYTMTEAAA